MATDTEPAGLSSVLRIAISDPASFIARREIGAGVTEPLPLWQARAVAIAIRPFLGRHDPSVNCNCERGTAGQCEYSMLSVAVADAFNPPDNEDAEVAICMTAVERAAQYIGFQDCICTPEMVADGEPCARCEVLGQLAGKPVQR